jgi:hypothetical protein
MRRGMDIESGWFEKDTKDIEGEEDNVGCKKEEAKDDRKALSGRSSNITSGTGRSSAKRTVEPSVRVVKVTEAP